MTFNALQHIADRAALYAALRQDQLQAANDTLGPLRWDVDMATPSITFSPEGDPSRAVTSRAHLIASLAPGPRSLLWGWAHPQGDAAGPVARLREHGEAEQIAALSSAELLFPEDTSADLDEWIAQAAHQVAAVAIELTGLSPYYSTPLGGGARAVFLLESPLPPLDLPNALIALPRILSQTTLADPRTSVWGLAKHAGWAMQWTDAAYSGAVLSDATAHATFRFDEAGRISGVESSIGGDAVAPGHPI